MAGRKQSKSGQHQAGLPIEDYRHEGATRPNNPPAAIAAEGRTPPAPRVSYAYSPRLDPALRSDPSGRADALPALLEKATREKLTAEEAALLAEALRRHEPWLEWAGKREAPGFAVDPVALHIHERVSTQAILRAAARQDVTRDLFADPGLAYSQAVKFYQHDVDWANRLILGDSLQVMASLAQRENLAGKVQMIYLDPPYGIRFGSNFQPETGKRRVSDREADLTREPEMVRAYRDTWRLGLHSYLTYLRDRLAMAKTLLADTGSIFVQIGDENVHRVRALMDEIFGRDNHFSTITYRTTTSAGGPSGAAKSLGAVADTLLWYARDAAKMKYRAIYLPKEFGDDGASAYSILATPDGMLRRMTPDERSDPAIWPEGARVSRLDNLTSRSGVDTTRFEITVDGKKFTPHPSVWKTGVQGMARLLGAARIGLAGNTPSYVRYLDDFPAFPLTNLWNDTSIAGFAADKMYVVQTSPRIIERCILMATDPGDLVLDPTCGSGTTATVAEQWGRRWITIDTSRVAVAIARQRILTAKFDHYRLKEEAKGVAGGFVCKTVPHIMLRSIAQNAALDPIFIKHDPILNTRLADLNTALSKVGSNQRSHLAGKLLTKQKAEGKRAVTEADRRRWDLPKLADGFQHWTVPFDVDPDHPEDLADAITAYRQAWRAKQEEVDEAIADAAEPEDLLDQPQVVRGVTRVSGPFTVEAVQPAETSLDESASESPIDGSPDPLGETFLSDSAGGAAAEPQNAEAYLDQMLRLLKMDGVHFLDKRVMKFSRLEQLGARSQAIHAEGRWALEAGTDADPEGRAAVAVAFGPQYGPVTAKQVEQLIRAASRRGYDDLVIAGFAFDGAAQTAIEEAEHPELRVHMANIRPDVNPGMAGLLKDAPASQLFTVFGKPRSTLETVGKNEWRVVMEGVDIYDPVSNTVTPSRADKVAAWFVDSDYDGRSFCITQAFFPDKDAWSKLSAALKGVMDEEAFAALSGTVSLPFPKGEHACVAVKVIDPRGNEVMRLHRLEG
ncbi:MAG: site-specific DNA-methyltransferase [Brevundimonas sp.]|nr:site-specific DNA-methyltransferase [Brevundimonas sp.]